MKTRIVIEVEGEVDLKVLNGCFDYSPTSRNPRHHDVHRNALRLLHKLQKSIVSQEVIPDPPLKAGDLVRYNQCEWHIVNVSGNTAIIDNGLVMVVKSLDVLERIKHAT